MLAPVVPTANALGANPTGDRSYDGGNRAFAAYLTPIDPQEQS